MHKGNNSGFSLIEILITIVILMVGLLGLAGLQGKAMTTQLESYQRSQALILLKDMADRMETNRSNAGAYVTGAIGAAGGCPAAGATVASQDLNAWCNALLGAAEVQSGGANIGAMADARGCIYQTVAPASGVAAQYLVAVVWQGMNRTAQPAVNCGQNLYGNDQMRRAVTLPVTVADLKSVL